MEAKIKQVVVAVLMLCSAVMVNHRAQASEGPRPFLGISAGTSGYGLQVGLQIGPRLSVRFVANTLSLEGPVALDGLDYQLHARLHMPQLLLDYRPFDNGFYFTGGLTRNRTELKGMATLSEAVEIGAVTVQAEEIGALRSSANYNGTTPYFGVGWRSGMRRAYAVQIDAGVTALSGVDVSLEELETTALSRAALDAEEQAIAADLDKGFGFYPHFRLGVTYRF